MPIVGGFASGTLGRIITLGPVNFSALDLGVRFRGIRLIGWDGSPGSTVQVVQKLRAPGGWASANPQMTARSLSLTGTIVGSDADTVSRYRWWTGG